MLVNPLYKILQELDELDAKRKPGPWWQKSWMCESCPPGAKTELSEMLCFFDDEGHPRFWDYMNDGQFIVKLENAWPLIREFLKQTLETPQWVLDYERRLLSDAGPAEERQSEH